MMIVPCMCFMCYRVAFKSLSAPYRKWKYIVAFRSSVRPFQNVKVRRLSNAVHIALPPSSPFGPLPRDISTKRRWRSILGSRSDHSHHSKLIRAEDKTYERGKQGEELQFGLVGRNWCSNETFSSAFQGSVFYDFSLIYFSLLYEMYALRYDMLCIWKNISFVVILALATTLDCAYQFVYFILWPRSWQYKNIPLSEEIVWIDIMK